MQYRDRFTRIVLAVAAAVLVASCATSPPDPAKTADGVLVNAAGMTLYTFDRDVPGSGKSVCNGPCAGLWPPFMVGGSGQSSAAWQVITRDDGGKQWAYLGKPLYTWSKDAKPGDKTGDGFNNVWKVAKP
jgi:predicted lipoprotein with Yx(FWY)xxD motif